MKPNDKRMIRQFRKMLEESGIESAPINDEVLMCFIRYRNEDLARALKALKSYMAYQKNHPELNANIKPSCPQLLANSVYHRLSPVRDQHGRFVYFAHFGLWKDDSCSWDDLLRVFIYDLHIAARDIDTQNKGAVGIADFKNFGIRKMRGLTPGFLKKVADVLQGGFPIKVKALICINHPWLVHTILKMLWPFLSNKLRSRIFLMDNNASLHKLIDPSCLPSDYEGHLGPIIEMDTVEGFLKPTTNMFDCLVNC